MTIFLKFAHLLALALGVGMGIANILLIRHAGRLPAEQRGAIPPLQILFGRIGFVAVIFLWLTGMALWFLMFDGNWQLGVWFHAKLAIAFVLTILAGAVQVEIWRAQRTARAPSAALIKPLAIAIPALAVLAVGAAVLSFAN